MSLPTVSIIVPVFNAEPYLHHCLASVQAQTFKEWECVCVDDASSDESAQMVESFVARDTRFRLIRQDNGGPGSARNTGLANTQGEWFAFVDADDVIHPNMVERLLGVARSHSADLAACQLLKFDGDSEIAWPDDDSQRDEDVKVYHGPLLEKMVDWRRFRVHPVGKLYERATHKGLRFPPLYGSEDAYASFDVYARVRCAVFCSSELYGYREVSSSLTNSVARYRNYIIGDAQVAMHCVEVCTKHHVEVAVTKQLAHPYVMRLFHYVNLMSVDPRLSSDGKREVMSLACKGVDELRRCVAGRFRVIPLMHTVVYAALRLKTLRLLALWQRVKRTVRRLLGRP